MLKVLFRVDGNSFIGLGHIMRCLSLAEEFRRQGAQVIFLSKYSEGISKIRNKGFEVFELENDDNHKAIDLKQYNYVDPSTLNAEADQIINVARSFDIDLLILDSYNVNQEYFLKLKEYVKKLAYIDDINKFIYPVDILINGNITGPYLNYKKFEPKEIMLLGLEYNLIRDEFRNIGTRVINEKVSSIMLTTGGSDPFNISIEILNKLIGDEDTVNIDINVIVGVGFRNKEKLRELAETHRNINLYENVERISEVMLASDLAISSGGSTLYELCACGTPTLAFIMADNQEFITSKMNELGYIRSLGWYRDIDSSKLLSEIKGLCEDFGKRKVLSTRMQGLVDGLGAARIVEEILKQYENSM